MQQLLLGIGSDNGSNVPSVVGGSAKRNNNDEDDSLSSSKKKGRKDNGAAFTQLSSSINKHSDSLVSAAQITAREQARNRVEARVSTLYARIDVLEDRRSAMAIRITETENQRTIDVLEREMKKIDDDIAMKMGEINGMSATPTRSNRSPTDV
jgi:TolA-binding protein